MRLRTAQEIADFLARFLEQSERVAPNPFPPHLYVPQGVGWVGGSPPTRDELAPDLLAQLEAEGLQLADALSTPGGQLLIEAVGLVIDPTWRADYELLVDALTLAAQLQQDGDRRSAGKLVLAVAAIFVLAVAFGSIRR